MEKVFTAEHLVIITSQVAIDALQWRKYIIDNWKKLMRKDSKLLVLAGIHGAADGTIGEGDQGLFEDYRRQIKFLKEKKYRNELTQHNMQIEIENIANHLDGSVMDPEKLVRAVKKHNPTVLSLSFCFTDKSVLNDILRAAGIYTVLIMSQDRASITEGKYVILDTTQRQIVESFALEPDKNVFLWGSSGTGKTLLLAQMLAMKISHYRKIGVRRLNIFVSAYHSGNRPNSLLIQDLKERYLVHLTDFKGLNILPFSDLLQSLGIKEDYQKPQLILKKVLKTLSHDHCETHNILFVDEIVPVEAEGEFIDASDWSKFMANDCCSNTDYLFALNPMGLGFQGHMFEVMPPEQALSKQLLVRHRNCFEIGILMEHLKHTRNKSHLENRHDLPLAKETLPNGRTPVWIQRGEHITDLQVLDEIKKRHIQEQDSVTLINNRQENSVVNWCKENQWRLIKQEDMVGSEDECVVILDEKLSFENGSRARKSLVFVSTQRGQLDQNDEDELSMVTFHGDQEYECPFGDETCQYMGTTLIRRIRMETRFTDRERSVLKDIFRVPLSDIVIDHLMKNDAIVFQLQKCLHPFNLTQSAGHDKTNYYRLLSLMGQVPEIEHLEMEIFLRNIFRKNRQVTPDVIRSVLDLDSVAANMRTVLRERGRPDGLEAFKRVKEAIVKATSQCLTAKYHCGLNYLRPPLQKMLKMKTSRRTRMKASRRLSNLRRQTLGHKVVSAFRAMVKFNPRLAAKSVDKLSDANIVQLGLELSKHDPEFLGLIRKSCDFKANK